MAELVTQPERRRRLAVGRPPGRARPNDRTATGWPRPTRPLRSPRPDRSGSCPTPRAIDKATAYLAREFARAGNDFEARAALLHALAAAGKASFEQANSLNRVRQNLPDVALAYLALTLAHLDRATWPARCSTSSPRGPSRSRPGSARSPGNTGKGRTRGLTIAGPSRPPRWPPWRSRGSGRRPPSCEAASEWLLAHRLGDGWSPTRPRARRSPRSPRSTARPGRPRTGTAWSSRSMMSRSTRPR